MSQADASSPFLPLPDGMVIVAIDAETSRVVVHIGCCFPSPTVPSAGSHLSGYMATM